MKSPEYVTHGTPSEKDAKNIEKKGFKAEEGRATVSTNLLYAYEWATDLSRRHGSKSETKPNEGEEGRIVIMKVPEGKRVDYATHSNIEVDKDKKEVSAYVDKYVSGKKQLAIYESENPKIRREEIENAKEEISSLKEEAEKYLKSLDIDSSRIKSREDLVKQIENFDIGKQIEILKSVEDYDKKINSKRKEAEIPLSLDQESILLSVRPSKELGKELEKFKSEIVNLKSPDLEEYLEKLSEIIEKDKNNYIGSTDVKSVLKNLLETTTESIVINHVRSLEMDVKHANGYKFKDRGDVVYPDKEINSQELREKLEAVKRKIDEKDFVLGSESLTRYIKTSVNHLLNELEGDKNSAS
ncbi:MAG: hypothetical protein WC842_00735 [Candidatus Paceibacterota bacterium]|jgi:hypothetical protein